MSELTHDGAMSGLLREDPQLAVDLLNGTCRMATAANC